MKKYIDADKLIAEIERLKKHSEEAKKEWVGEGYNQNAFAEDCCIRSFDKLLSFITSLQQEQPEVDLEKEIRLYQMNHNIISHSENGLNMYMESIARHFYELGLNARKEETK